MDSYTCIDVKTILQYMDLENTVCVPEHIFEKDLVITIKLTRGRVRLQEEQKMLRATTHRAKGRINRVGKELPASQERERIRPNGGKQERNLGGTVIGMKTPMVESGENRLLLLNKKE